MNIRVMLADSHEQYRDALCMALEQETDISVVAQAGSDLAALEAMTRVPVHVVCLDVRIAVLGGIETTRLLLQRFPHVRVIGLSIHDDPELVRGMIGAGASAFVLKMDVGRDLPLVIRRVRYDKTYGSQFMPRIVGTV